MIEGTSAMDRTVEDSKGISRKALAFRGAAVTLGVVALLALVPTFKRWSSSERSVASAAVRRGRVTRGELVRDAAAQGKIVTSVHPTLFTPAQGTVTLLVKAGTSVQKGQVLARVESPELRSRLLQELSTLESLQSAFERQRIAVRQASVKHTQDIDLLELKLQASRRALERAERTFQEGLLNKTDYEKAKDDLAIATLELKNTRETARLEDETSDFEVKERRLQAERQASFVSELKRQVAQLWVTAPCDGLVSSVAIQDRDAVPANSPLLTVVNLGTYEVEITLPENYAVDAAPGTKALILYEGKEYPGKVTAVSPEIHDSQVKGTVVFEGEGPGGLRQSQRVSVRMLFERRSNVLKVPRGPFLESGGGRRVYVVKNGVATLQDVEVGAVSVSEVEITRGLSEGDEIILSDTTELQGARTVLIRD